MREVRQVEAARVGKQRTTVMSDGRNLEIKNKEREKVTTFSATEEKAVSQRCCLLFEAVWWSGSCNELTIIYMSVTHTCFRLFKTFPLTESPNPCRNGFSFSRVDAALCLNPTSVWTASRTLQCVVTGETVADCHRKLAWAFCPESKKKKK